ncbi:MAG: hypothetical protein ACI8XX_001776, partial [Polaribacter sp.]
MTESNSTPLSPASSGSHDLSWFDRCWQPGIVLTALIFSIPIFTIAGYIFLPIGDVWQHLVDTVLLTYLINSALLM